MELWSGPFTHLRGEAAFHAIEQVNNTPEDLDVWEFRLALDWKGPAFTLRPPDMFW